MKLFTRHDIANIAVENYATDENKEVIQRLLIGGKLVHEHRNPKRGLPYMSLFQDAFLHVFYWDEAIPVVTAEERSSLLNDLQAAYSQLSDKELKVTGPLQWDTVRDGVEVRVTRHYRPDRKKIRTYVSFLEETQHNGFLVEHKHSTAEETGYNEKPTDRLILACKLVRETPRSDY